MTYDTHRHRITRTSDHQLFVFHHLSGMLIGKVVYEWGYRPFSERDCIERRYIVRHIRSE